MKNWFKNKDPNNFAKTQKWYVKQIDDYLQKATVGKTPKQDYYGHGKKEIMKKIEKGYQVNETELRKISGNKHLLGSSELYNQYLIKLL